MPEETCRVVPLSRNKALYYQVWKDRFGDLQAKSFGRCHLEPSDSKIRYRNRVSAGCCKSSWATLKYTNWIAKRCKWVTRPKNRCRCITEGNCKNLIITIPISPLWFAPRIERPSRNCVSLTPLYMTTCDFISITFDIRLKNLVAISTVKDAKFEVCKYTWATEWQNLASRMRRIRSSNLSW